jgi:hypothetical protein
MNAEDPTRCSPFDSGHTRGVYPERRPFILRLRCMRPTLVWFGLALLEGGAGMEGLPTRSAVDKNGQTSRDIPRPPHNVDKESSGTQVTADWLQANAGGVHPDH